MFVHALRYSLTVFFCLLTFSVWAQDGVRVGASAKELLERERAASALETTITEETKDGFARTPLDAVLGMRAAAKRDDFAAVAKYLDLRYVPEDVLEHPPEQLARAFIWIWIQQNVMDFAEISPNPDGNENDDLPFFRDQVGTVKLSTGEVPVYLQQIPDGQGGKIWKISNATVKELPLMWSELGYSDFAIWLGDKLPHFSFLGMQNWQVTALVVGLFLAWYLAWLITWMMTRLCLLVPNNFERGIKRFWRVPARIIIFLLIGKAIIKTLGLSVTARVYLQSAGIDYLAITLAITGLISLYRDYRIEKAHLNGEIQYVALISPITTIIKFIIFMVAFLLWAKEAGFNVTTLVAGLGVGSLAVALAAQKTLENIIGAMTLYAARPVKAGDFCRFGTVKGTVEEIGLRSVLLRTLDRTLVSVPNAMFSAVDVENISARDRIRYFKQLQLQMTTANQLRVILGEMRALFASHPKVIQETVSIRLEGIDAAIAIIRVDAGIQTRDYQEYLAVAEDLNLRTIELVHSNGAIFSGPGQVLQMREFYQASDETMSEVNQKLEGWRDSEKLPFPDLSPEEKADLKASLDYPPTGSANKPPEASPKK